MNVKIETTRPCGQNVFGFIIEFITSYIKLNIPPQTTNVACSCLSIEPEAVDQFINLVMRRQAALARRFPGSPGLCPVSGVSIRS